MNLKILFVNLIIKCIHGIMHGYALQARAPFQKEFYYKS